MDWILKHAIDGEGGGLDWLDGNKLADLDFADDIVLVDETWECHGRKLRKRPVTGRCGEAVSPDVLKAREGRRSKVRILRLTI